MRRKLPVLALGLFLVTCGKQSTTGAETGSAPGGLALSVRWIDEEVSKDSNSEEIQISLSGSTLTYEQTRSGFGAEQAADMHTSVRLADDEMDLIKAWIADGRLMEIVSVEDRSEVEPGPHHRRTIDIGIGLGDLRHEFGLHGVASVKGNATAFGRRGEVGRTELFITRLTDLVRRKRPRLFEARR